jgi:copper chaperone CopZ
MSNTASPPSSNKVARASLVGAVVAALAASACCLGPAILAIVGLSGVGLAATLAPYRPIFLGVTAALLGAGFYLSYRKPKVAAPAGAGAGGATGDACCDTAGCEMPRAARSGRKLLWFSTLLVVAFAAYPYVAGAFAKTSASGTAAPVASAATARIHVDGMTCEECVTQITTDLTKVKGVIKAEVSFSDSIARVTYDPAQVKPDAFLPVIDKLGYTARVDN